MHASTSPFQSSLTTEKLGPTSTIGQSIPETEDSKLDKSYPRHTNHTHHRYHHSNIIAQVADWLKHEKAKKALRQSRKRNAPPKVDEVTDTANDFPEIGEKDSLLHIGGRTQTPSEISDDDVDLNQLEQILSGIETRVDPIVTPKRDSYFPYRQSSSSKVFWKSSVGASSDREHGDADALVPAAEVILDNSKTIAFSGSATGSAVSLPESRRRAMKEKEAWLHFKNEIVRLAHTLKLKGWRRVPLDRGGEVDVQRLSGALTNAVYVVSPPNNLPQVISSSHSGTAPSSPRKVASPP